MISITRQLLGTKLIYLSAPSTQYSEWPHSPQLMFVELGQNTQPVIWIVWWNNLCICKKNPRLSVTVRANYIFYL